MKKVSAENTSFYIWGTSEIISLKKEDMPLDVQNINQLRLKDIYHGNDIRLVLFASFLNTQKGHLYWLYWKDGKTPENLKSVINSENQNMDWAFEDSVKTVFQVTECAACGRSFPTLVIPPGDPYPAAPGLYENKIKKFEFLKCPNCGSRFRQMVVKIIDTKISI